MFLTDCGESLKKVSPAVVQSDLGSCPRSSNLHANVIIVGISRVLQRSHVFYFTQPKIQNHIYSCPASGFNCIDCGRTFDRASVKVRIDDMHVLHALCPMLLVSLSVNTTSLRALHDS
jgi:hypothetical protein